jgi:hypothetical protein
MIEERQLYHPIQIWLQSFLISRFKTARVSTSDTSRIDLSKFISLNGMIGDFPNSSAWEIKVDITSFIFEVASVPKLAFVEVKRKPIVLKDVGQLIGYCKVAIPEFAFLISPSGLSSRLRKLLSVFGRTDILNYSVHKGIIIAEWDLTRNSISSQGITPPGILPGYLV